MTLNLLDTHYPISLYAIERGIHVLVTKPATQLLSHHNELINAAQKHNVVCFVEHHKRFDPVYSDAKAKAQTLGEFNFFSAWMSQPKSQLETFKTWAGKDSDIRSMGTNTIPNIPDPVSFQLLPFVASYRYLLLDFGGQGRANSRCCECCDWSRNRGTL